MLSKHKFPGTIVYAALSGEEQGLLRRQGARRTTPRRRAGTSSRSSTTTSSATAARRTACAIARMRACCRKGRGRRAQAELAAQTHSLGGENDSPSRNISRYLDSLADRLKIGLDVRQIWRTDRFGRGGDHIPFLEAGYPAARISVAVENYDWQHQDLQDREGQALRRHDRPCGLRLSRQDDQAERRRARSIASAPPPPEPKVEGAVSTDTTLTWAGPLEVAPTIATWFAGAGRIANNWRRAVSRPCMPAKLGCSMPVERARSSCPTSASTIGCSASRR